MGKFDNYLYYKGESENPFEDKDFGKAFWWRLEFEAAQPVDKKEKDKLSPIMIHYIREKIWQNESGGWNTSWETALKRAHELYIKGLWCASYISCENYTIKDVERMNQ